MEDYLGRISRRSKASKKGKGYTSFDELRKGISSNAIAFTDFVRDVMSSDAEEFDYLMSLSGKRFLLELRTFVKRAEKARNERDKRAAK